MYVMVDHEFNSPAFWQAFYETFPQCGQDIFRVTPEEWEVIQALPGFDDGPEWAPHPFVRVED